jgi:FKBP-type peptidyl-prolyl cis-trans isomerase
VEKKFPGFSKDENGIYFKITKEGSGAKCGKKKHVYTEYKGYLVDGKVFDQSAGRGPLDFTTDGRQMIPGYDIMVQDMKLGEKRTIVIPSDLAYGDQGYPGVIPGGAYIAFDIELVKIQ